MLDAFGISYAQAFVVVVQNTLPHTLVAFVTSYASAAVAVVQYTATSTPFSVAGVAPGAAVVVVEPVIHIAVRAGTGRCGAIVWNGAFSSACDSPLVQMAGGSFPTSDGGTAGLASPGSTPRHAPTVTSGGTTGRRVIPSSP